MSIFQDIFSCDEVDPQGKKFDTVSRMVCKSENYEMDMTIDVNSDLMPIERGFKFSVELATTLNVDNTPDTGVYDQRPTKPGQSRLDNYDYAMHGKVFKIDKEAGEKMALFASFGGLLMKLVGDHRNLNGAELDSRVYILMKRIIR